MRFRFPALRVPSLPSAVTGFVVLASAVFVFLEMHPDLIFTNTTTAGGDMGAHVWAPQYMRDHLLPHGRVTGWTPDWYAGFPALHFYFPLPSVVIVLLDLLLPYNVAFKLVTIAGVCSLPVAAWAFGRLARLPFPVPAVLSAATLLFLFDTGYTIFGGNIASTLAGEFAFSIGLSLAIVFLGLVVRGLDTGRYRAIAALVFGLTILSHILPTLLAFVGGLILLGMSLFTKPGGKARIVRQFGWAVPVAVVGGLLSCAWLVPFVLRSQYMNDMGWEKMGTGVESGVILYGDKIVRYTDALFPTSLSWALVAGFAGGALALYLRRRIGIFFVLLAGISAAGFILMPQGRLWNARLLPFWYLSLYMLAGLLLAEVGWALAEAARNRSPRAVPAPGEKAVPAPGEKAVPAPGEKAVPAPGEREFPATSFAAAQERKDDRELDPEAGSVEEDPPATRSEVATGFAEGLATTTPVLALVVALLIVMSTLPRPDWWPHSVMSPWFDESSSGTASFVPGWAEWNYSGYERKDGHGEYAELVAAMADIGRTSGCGRAMWEYESQLDRFGTPMALMLLPKWTHGCIGSMEGLFFESSATVPYHFLNQAELSQTPSSAMRNLPYPTLDVTAGVSKLQLLGVKYYMAVSPEAQRQAAEDSRLTLLRSVPAAPAEDKTPRTWNIYAVAGSDLVTPLQNLPAVMTSPGTVEHTFQLNSPDDWLPNSVPWYQDPAAQNVFLAASGPAEWPRVANKDETPPEIPVDPVNVEMISTGDDRISFHVDRTGVPVLVKASYFPNWQASGAKGPYRVTPNLMVVVPTSKDVTLHYGRTTVDYLGLAGSLLGIAGLVWLWRRDRRDGQVTAPSVDKAGTSSE